MGLFFGGGVAINPWLYKNQKQEVQRKEMVVIFL